METAVTKSTTTTTPKAIIHRKYGNKACYKIEEVQEESSENECPGLAIPPKKTCLFRCHLELPELSFVSQPCKKKKEAQQSAASMAIQKLRIDSQKISLTVSDAADELISRLEYLFSIEFLSSLHPVSSHLKAISYREGELNGSLPVSVLTACDAKLGNLCRSIDAGVESNAFLSIPLVMGAAVGLSTLLVSEEDFWIKRKNPYPSDAISALANQHSDEFGSLTEAVYIPFSLYKDVRPIFMNLYSEAYYLDVIARELGVIDASKVLISRTIGKASSESRLYLSALEARNLSSVWEIHDATELVSSDSTFNVRASYLMGQHVYGNAILASIGYTRRGVELFNEDISLRSYFRMLIARTPDGLYKLSRDAVLVADLPRLFTTKTYWRGSLPRDLLCEFCRQHRLSEPVFSVVCNSIQSDQDLAGSCKIVSNVESMSKTGGAVDKDNLNLAAVESYSCEIKVFSKNHNLILESTVDSFMKQGHAVQNASLKALHFLNLYFKQPNISLEKLSLLGVDCDIKVHSTCFLKEFSLIQLVNQAQQSSHLQVEHNRNINHIDPSTDSTILVENQLIIKGTACGSVPSNGFLVSISYSVFLVSEGKELEILEKNDEFDFEIGTGAVISCIEAAILQMTAGQSVCFCMDMPQKELVSAATMNSRKVLSFLSSRRCCLEYSITLLRVTEPFEDRMEQALFSPPLSKQRVEFALQCIKDLSATSLVDFGCGSGSLLESLVDAPSSLEKIVGIDLSQKGLTRAAKVLNSKLEKMESVMSKSKIKSAILYEGSITDFDSRLSAFDIGACLEVIEHMEEDQACLFGDIALGLFRPRVLIVSTPNYEYNVILQGSNLATREEDLDEKAQKQSCKFRNHDHKFEWTREQFNHWASFLAQKYNYSVEFGGVGGKDGVEPGFASQIAVFKRDQHEPVQDSAILTQTQNHYKTIWEWEATATISSSRNYLVECN